MQNKSTTKKKNVNIAHLNKVANKNILKVVCNADKKYHRRVENTAKKIAHNCNTKVVFLSGPSASGKTTTSFFLKKYFQNYGRDAVVVSLDDFFLDGDKRPLDENGKPNYELPENININLFKKVVDELLIKGRAKFPRFDFKKAKRSDNVYEIALKENTIIIVEGIHALNPILYDDLILKNSAKVYVCPNRNFSYKGKKVISTNELRLLRRMLRDSITRSTSFEKMLELWDNVNKGTEKFVKPYKKTAKYIIDTTHEYEVYVYKKIMAPQFEKIKNNRRIAELLSDFKFFNCELGEEAVPELSLINEFLGRDF